jgi:ribonuclease HI
MKAVNHDSVIIFTDGGSRGNPGRSALGFVIKNVKNETIDEFGKYIGETTNNVAEYMAVISALQRALSIGVKNAVIKTDSQLVARQINGEYKVKEKQIALFHGIVRDLVGYFEKIDIVEIPREENKEADRLVNTELDKTIRQSLF